MKESILKQMDELKADGVDFVSFGFKENIPQIYCSYSRKEFDNIEIIPKSNYRFWKMINGTKTYIEQLNTLTKLVTTTLSERPSPQIEREQNLLAEIAKITDYETANKAKDLLHSTKNVYDFNDYLHWLSELKRLLLRGVPTDKAFDHIWAFIVKTYQEPLAIFRD